MSADVASSGGARAEESATRLIECHECGLMLRAASLAPGARARCPRCGYKLYRATRGGSDKALALNVAALVLFVVANSFPFMTFKLEGREQQSTLISGALEFIGQGLWPLGLLVLALVVVVPAIKLLATLQVLIAVRAGRTGVRLARLFRLVEILHPWAMMEVFLLGVLVAYVKLIDLATLELGPALFAFAGLIIVMVAAESVLEPREIWQRFGHGGTPPAPARELTGCHVCNLVSPLPATHGRPGARPACPRCGALLHHRKPASLSRSWALLLTGYILYVPANVFPIMTVISFGRGAPDTILSGVVHLFEAGMWPLALLVFFASVTVPMAKLIGLTYLLVSVQRRSRWRPRERTVLYRMVEAVGRWSMIDIFMIAILVALVKLGSIATIEPGVGATSFAAVVVVTMIAATSFDPRLIWDAAEANRGAQ